MVSIKVEAPNHYTIQSSDGEVIEVWADPVSPFPSESFGKWIPKDKVNTQSEEFSELLDQFIDDNEQ